MGDVAVDLDARGCATLRLRNMARRNALDDAMLETFLDALARLSRAGGCRTLVIRGEGGDFCAGREIGPGAHDASLAERHALFRPLADLATAVCDFPRPTIAAVDGYALGIGSAMVTWCDFALATQGAKFGYPEVTLGIPATVTGVSLTQALPRRQAIDLLFTGRRLSADEAAALGLVTGVVPDDGLDDALEDLVATLCRASPDAVYLTKQLVRGTQGIAFERALEQAVAMSSAAAGTEDAREGASAFREKRLPVWPSENRAGWGGRKESGPPTAQKC